MNNLPDITLPAPTTVTIGDVVVRLFTFHSNDWLAVSGAFSAVLDAHEAARVAAMQREAAKQRYRVRRGLLRHCLGAHLARAARDIRIVYGAHGKPLLADVRCWFNVTHTQTQLAIAICDTGPVGIDLELLTREVDSGLLAKRVLGSAEREALAALPADKQQALFLRYWCAKEAALKAWGLGIASDMRRVSVHFARPPDAGVVRRDSDEPALALQFVNAPAQHLLAVCVPAAIS